MKGALVAAWLLGLGIVAYRDVSVQHRMPAPGQLLGVSALFLGLAAVAEYTPAAGLATAAAWGLDLAGVLNLPAGFWSQVSQAEAGQSPAPASTTSTGPPAAGIPPAGIA